MLTIEGFDHIVLTVASIEETCAFYNKVLGMEIVTFGEGRKALRFGQSKINLHQQGQEIDPKADKPTPGSADMCFVTRTSVTEVLAHLSRCEVKIVEGPVTRTGAAGEMNSVYFRDPDLNLIEVSNY